MKAKFILDMRSLHMYQSIRATFGFAHTTLLCHFENILSDGNNIGECSLNIALHRKVIDWLYRQYIET